MRVNSIKWWKIEDLLHEGSIQGGSKNFPWYWKLRLQLWVWKDPIEEIKWMVLRRKIHKLERKLGCGL